MPFHQDKDVSFDSPPEWLDRTIVGHAAPTVENDDRAIVPNFVMTRQAMRQNETLRTHADREIFQLGQRLKGFALEESSDTTLGGLPAVHYRYTWTSFAGPLEQSLTLVERQGEGGRFAMLFTTTTSLADAGKTRPIYARLFKTVRFDGDVAKTSPPPPPLELRRPHLAPVNEEAPKSVPMPGVRRGFR